MIVDLLHLYCYDFSCEWIVLLWWFCLFYCVDYWLLRRVFGFVYCWLVVCLFFGCFDWMLLICLGYYWFAVLLACCCFFGFGVWGCLLLWFVDLLDFVVLDLLDCYFVIVFVLLVVVFVCCFVVCRWFLLWLLLFSALNCIADCCTYLWWFFVLCDYLRMGCWVLLVCLFGCYSFWFVCISCCFVLDVVCCFVVRAVSCLLWLFNSVDACLCFY